MLDRTGPTVGVLGSYGGLNLGDEAILTSLLDDLRNRRPDARILVFSRHPENTKAKHPNVEVVGWEGISRQATATSLGELDLLILGGGGILYNTEARRYLRVAKAAQERGVPVFTYALARPAHRGDGLRHRAEVLSERSRSRSGTRSPGWSSRRPASPAPST